jgi:hypothetical protein
MKRFWREREDIGINIFTENFGVYIFTENIGLYIVSWRGYSVEWFISYLFGILDVA